MSVLLKIQYGAYALNKVTSFRDAAEAVDQMAENKRIGRVDIHLPKIIGTTGGTNYQW